MKFNDVGSCHSVVRSFVPGQVTGAHRRLPSYPSDRDIMSVHLVETSEEDSYLAVTRHVADLLNEGEVSRRPAHLI